MTCARNGKRKVAESTYTQRSDVQCPYDSLGDLIKTSISRCHSHQQ